MTKPITPDMIDPELRAPLAKMPNAPLHAGWFRALAPFLMRLQRRPPTPGVSIEVRKAPACRIYRPQNVRSDGALLWIHGGGYVVGMASMDDVLCGQVAAELGLTVVSAEYRLAPKHPYPAALNDCHAVWCWLLAEAKTLGIDPQGIAIGGISAGGGLAAALVQRVCDEEGPEPAAQWLMAPMLDDRTAAHRDLDELAHPLWNNAINRFGWRSYLGREPGAVEVSSHAAPARHEDLSGLPPAWIGVGAIELFHDEDVDYARRLEAAGVPVALEVVPNAPHGFEAWGRGTQITERYLAKAIRWLGEQVG
ncbi:acetyl esterase/lipase [Novosphingobium chloroacetimidivorans]|uniref:Acetyl esterase/lipase n=1 Tax=Novosphingobium chloroacetimidivorans TaxID=1428314 RepID=A0A7W7K6H2_9SPHN|nr:alpha/beta hydrolase [Novosphingobium chloroacetimidivorans]MBB4857147.1 acetyl esterase/lipase [Novosphingobium chloroacetimidivorans]